MEEDIDDDIKNMPDSQIEEEIRHFHTLENPTENEANYYSLLLKKRELRKGT